MAFSPDGKQVLAGINDGTALLWDAQGGQELRAFTGRAGSVSSVAFSPDGKQVLTGSYDRRRGCGTPRTARKSAPFRGMAGRCTPWRSRRTASRC